MNKYVVNMDGNILEVLASNERELNSFLFSIFDVYRLAIIKVIENYNSNAYPSVCNVVKSVPTIIK